MTTIAGVLIRLIIQAEMLIFKPLVLTETAKSPPVLAIPNSPKAE
jgi:hypothetical protein